ncbi:B3 domain-containing protein Os01g0234100-like [Malania oleifera]|uniref:B3 domain-containing protein Os01g0234100-like n=1 Tax=Malania oleifera TaxID=397392 RepID=UPI0025AEBD67|nr:B3 domain-containing protein Os01g0234100-like [Malania oleifera]
MVGVEKRAMGSSALTTKQAADPGKRISYKRKREMSQRNDDCREYKPSVMQRATEVQANCAVKFPSFVKSMLPSHVTGGFWLGLPKKFCAMHLPKHDATVVLEDESNKEYETKYLVGKTGLSGGWRGFSIAHKLLTEDVLVFQLVKPTKFKVYIVRAKGLTEVDGALGLLNLDDRVKKLDFEKDVKLHREAEENFCKPLSLGIPPDTLKVGSLTMLKCGQGLLADHSENDSEDLKSEVLDGIRLLDSAVDFKEVNSIENFTIHVNGLVIDSEFSKHLRTKYYELCCSQKSFLHDHLLEGLNCKLAAGIISETINIADAIRASKLTTPQDSFSIWDKTLKAFQELGMKVGFLQTRLDRLSHIAFKSQEAAELKRYKEAKRNRVLAEEEMKILEARLLEVNEITKTLDSEIEALKMSPSRLEFKFQEEVNAPW